MTNTYATASHVFRLARCNGASVYAAANAAYKSLLLAGLTKSKAADVTGKLTLDNAFRKAA